MQTFKTIRKNSGGGVLNILLQANSIAELYIGYAVAQQKFGPSQVDAVVPESVFRQRHFIHRENLNIIRSFSDRFKFVTRPSHFLHLFEIQRFFAEAIDRYDHIVFGAYRTEFTSVALREIGKHHKVFTFYASEVHWEIYKPAAWNLRRLVNSIFLRVFGVGDFKYYEHRSGATPETQYFSETQHWRHDPFYPENILFISVADSENPPKGKDVDLVVTLSEYGPQKRKERRILLIGERMPPVPDNREDNIRIINDLFEDLLRADAQIFMRPRKGLTDADFYAGLNPIILSPDQPFDDQLIKLQPDAVLSFKSTACKYAAAYGLPSMLLYPCLELSDVSRSHLDGIFVFNPELLIKNRESFRQKLAEAL